MPYTNPDQVPEWVPAAKKKQFMEVWNSVFKKAKADGKSDKDAEQLAFAEATSVIKKTSSSAKKREVRFLDAAELRIKPDGKIVGYAAPFNSWSEDLGLFREIIRPGAFKRAIESRQDVRALFNHDPNLVLGRTSSGTLTLSEDDHGLLYEITPPDTQFARDLMKLIERGDIAGSSFGFSVVHQRWGSQEDESGAAFQTRELLDVDLYDVSPVTFPAYPDSSVGLRALWPDGAPEEIARLMEGRDRMNADCEQHPELASEDEIYAAMRELEIARLETLI